MPFSLDFFSLQSYDTNLVFDHTSDSLRSLFKLLISFAYLMFSDDEFATSSVSFFLFKKLSFNLFKICYLKLSIQQFFVSFEKFFF